MRGILFTFFLSLLAVTQLHAQGVDVGLHLGASNYLGDIGGTDQSRRNFISDVKLEQTQMAVGAHIRYESRTSWAYTAMFMFGKVQGFDSDTEYAPRRARNLNFRNNIYELSARAEYTLFSDNDLMNRGYFNPSFTLYAFSGVAAIMHNPQGFLEQPTQDLERGWYDLRELRTEGQEKPYSQFTVAVPMGIGMYITHNREWRFGWELGYRLSGTDYLDDISTSYAHADELDGDLATALANQTTREIVEDAFGDDGAYYSYHYRPNHLETDRNPRGVSSNRDGYIFSTFSVSKVIESRSRYSRSRHKWLKGRQKKRRKARAKF